jgi:hypothetical protein
METKQNNMNVKTTKKIGRPKKTGLTSIAQQTNKSIVETPNIEINNVAAVAETNQIGKPVMVDKAVNTIESALRDPPKELDIPLNLEPFTYDEILDYSDDLDLSYYKGRVIERERDEMRYAMGYRHEVIINDKSIGHAIFHNIPGKSYWNGYINIEPTYCNPFIVQADITRINFLGCQLKEVTYIDDEHFGFDHLDLEDLEYNIFTGEKRKRFYATLDVVQKEIIALYIFLNFFIGHRLSKKKNKEQQNLSENDIEIVNEIEKKPEVSIEQPIKVTKGRKAKETAKPAAKATKASNKTNAKK